MSEDNILGAMRSESANLYLANLIGSLGIAARDPERVTAERLSGFREITIALATQLATRLGGGPAAYPDQALLEVIRDKAAAYDCSREVAWAAQRALETLEGQSS